MSHRSGNTSRHRSAGDRRVLVLGIVLVATALGLSTCDSFDDLLDKAPAVDVWLTTAPGGVQE